MKDSQVFDALCSIVGPENVSCLEENLRFHSRDALSPHRAYGARGLMGHLPACVVTPQTTQHVVKIVGLAQRFSIPVVPYGGGTGVMGATVPKEGAIILDLKGMRQILAISVEDRTATVQAGVVLKNLEEELNRHGLILGHDPWSLPIATVGGAIATNGHGYRASKYGAPGDQVLGLEVVLASGQVLSTRAVPKSTIGPSLNHLFIGSEGTLGIITQATLRVFAKPEKRSLFALRFSSFETGFYAIQEMYGVGLYPALIDYGEEDSPSEPDRDALPAKLYLGFEGFQEEVEAQQKRALEICHRHGGRSLGERRAQDFWDHRHQIAERYQRDVLLKRNKEREPWRRAFDYIHVALPASHVLEYRRRCRALLKDCPILVREAGLWTSPELFSLILTESPNIMQPEEAMAEAVDQLLMLAQDMGGSMEYCHGVGIKLKHLMARELGVGMEVIQGIKGALDPKDILNPGKLGL